MKSRAYIPGFKHIPVSLKYGKLATKYPWIYGYFSQCGEMQLTDKDVE